MYISSSFCGKPRFLIFRLSARSSKMITNTSETPTNGSTVLSVLDQCRFLTISLLSIGVLANISASITLIRIKIVDARKPKMSATSMLILQHQALTDLVVCIITLAFECCGTEHPRTTPGQHTIYGPLNLPYVINIVACYIWESYVSNIHSMYTTNIHMYNIYTTV
jgi:hypothetical protein